MIPGRWRRWLGGLCWAVCGVLVTGLVMHALQARTLPDLAFWHEHDFAESVVPELDNIGDASWQDYLDHETLIFDALAAAVQVEGAGLPFWHRYNPERYQEARRNLERWNRSSLLTPASASGAALLVHGLSDSPYSMHALADALYRTNLRVLNLRVPGHGTVPGALDIVSWRDFRAAYDLAVRTLVQSLPEGEPLVLVGYSNGSSLAVDYALRALASGGDLRRPDLLILVSPAMRVSPLAALAWVQKWMAELPGLEKLNWTDILPEYDPYKYNSFPLSAGQQIYQLTQKVQSSLQKASHNELAGFPPVLAFQSVVDATIPPSSIVTGLLSSLAGSPVELILFDINRNSAVLPMLRGEGDQTLWNFVDSDLSADTDLTVVTNSGPDERAVVARRRPPGVSDWQVEALGVDWPADVYSLAHVALPFPARDPLYGVAKTDWLIQPGQIQARGEKGLFVVPMDLLARQRYNPFYDYLERRALAALARLDTP